jgi:Flp pilus assembly protein TadG
VISERAPRRGAEHGQVLVLMGVILPVLLVFVGVAIDGSRLFQARLDAQMLADEAADAGAQEIDVGGGSAARAGNAAQLVQGRMRGSAYAVASDVLGSRVGERGDTRWSVEVGPRVITVEVDRDVELAFMPLAGFRTRTVVARSVSGPIGGIGAP